VPGNPISIEEEKVFRCNAAQGVEAGSARVRFSATEVIASDLLKRNKSQNDGIRYSNEGQGNEVARPEIRLRRRTLATASGRDPPKGGSPKAGPPLPPQGKQGEQGKPFDSLRASRAGQAENSRDGEQAELRRAQSPAKHRACQLPNRSSS